LTPARAVSAEVSSTSAGRISIKEEWRVPSTRRLRVLHFLWNGSIGGAERAVFQLVREQLRDPGLEPALLFARGEGLYWEQAQSLGCQVVALDLPHGHAVSKLPAAVEAMRPFAMHHFHSAEPLLMLASTRCRGVCRVYTHRGGLINYSPAKRLQYELSGVLLRRFFHGFSGNTEHGARCGAKLYRLPEPRFELTYNGLDFALLTPDRPAEAIRASLGLTRNDLVVGTAANLKAWKRIDRLIEALKSLPTADVRLLIVGDGPDRERLETRATRLGVSPRVIFAGRQQQVASYLQAMDVFSLPSMGLESFGNAAVEAMALGLPTIVFADGGGLVEHIEDGETGFVVSNQAELEATLRRLFADVELRRCVGDRARRVVREKYSTTRAASAYRALYASALRRLPSAR
jgi:glycosyltransferase involved in cell wall biosynthesis